MLTAAPARAQMVDCTSPDYLEHFPGSPPADAFFCEEFFHFTADTPGGPREIRGIRDLNGGWAVPPGAAAAVEAGARDAATAFAALGDFRVDNITIYLYDNADDITAAHNTAEVLARTGAGSDGLPGECLITMYTLHPFTASGNLRETVAHEIFHCIENASLSTAQYETIRPGGAGVWWGEGAAEYFTAFAVPDSRGTRGWGDTFDAAVQADTPLNEMGFAATIFFFWLHQQRGPAGLMPFLHQMAASDSAEAQQAAMRGAMSQEEWLNFANDYADNAIMHPQGGAATPEPDFRDQHMIDSNTTEHIQLDPFVIQLGHFDYDCSVWGHRLTPPNPPVRARFHDIWGVWPEEVDAREASESQVMFVGMSSAAGREDVSVEVERRASCQPCAGSARVDACLAGTWQMVKGGPVEWMKNQGLPITRAPESPRYVTFRSDGVYGAEPVGVELTMREDDTVAEGTGWSTAAFGRWSAEDGTLNICQDAGGMSGRVTVTDSSGSVSGPVSHPGAGTISMHYTCTEAGSLDTVLDIPGMAPMPTSYTKIAEEPPAPGAPH